MKRGEAMAKIFWLLLLISYSAWALEVDERLTLRVVKTSNTHKTILINRGTEDGLVEGDHAKFFISAGVVARGICVKVSPSRSVWSLYRLVSADLIVPETVMNLKIAPPVKITQDETKMIVPEDVPVATSKEAPLGVPLAEGANDVSADEIAAGKADLAALEAQGPGHLRDRNWEFWSALHVGALNSKTSGNGVGTNSYSGSSNMTQLMLALEWYSKQEEEWWARFSPFLFLNYGRSGNLSFFGANQDLAATEFGLGLNWHPWTLPSTVNEFIPFISASVAMGTVSEKWKSGNGMTDQSLNASGSSVSTALGLGYKFYTTKGFGARAVLDYYIRNESLTDDTTAKEKWTRTLTGPRLWAALSYRW